MPAKLGFRARKGDRVLVEGRKIGVGSRAGTILEVLGEPGAERYRISWDDGHVQPLDRVGQAPPAFEVPRLRGQLREQMTQPFGSNPEEPTVAGDPHDRLSDTERDDLRVCDHSSGVPWWFRQEIVSRAINGDAESVEVGVHRGLLADDGVFGTADFGLSAQNPSNTAIAVESII